MSPEIAERALAGAVAVALAIAFARRVRSLGDTRRREARGRCARCGIARGTTVVVDLAYTTATLCDDCAEQTARNHRAAYRFLIGMGVLGFTGVTAGLVSDVVSGHGASWLYLWAYAMVGFGPLLLGRRIRARMLESGDDERASASR